MPVDVQTVEVHRLSNQVDGIGPNAGYPPLKQRLRASLDRFHQEDWFSKPVVLPEVSIRRGERARSGGLDVEAARTLIRFVTNKFYKGLEKI